MARQIGNGLKYDGAYLFKDGYHQSFTDTVSGKAFIFDNVDECKERLVATRKSLGHPLPNFTR